jgi:DNA-binding transcriptional MerR regulator
VPAEIDPASGYRFYEPGQVPIAQVIRRFRDLGMPPDEIREVLQAPDVRTRNRVLVAHMQRMESQLAVAQSVVASLRSLLERQPAPIAVEHRSVSPMRALAISEQVSAPDLDTWWDAAFRELGAALSAASRRQPNWAPVVQSHSVFIAGAAWMHTSRARPGPLLVKPCGVPAGPMTMSPGPPSRLSSPTRTRTLPSRMMKVSS